MFERLCLAAALLAPLASCAAIDTSGDRCAEGCATDPDREPSLRGLFPSGEHFDDEGHVPAGWEIGLIAAGGHDRVRVDDLFWLSVESGPFRVTGADALEGRIALVDVHADAAGDGVLEHTGYPDKLAVRARTVRKVSLVPPRHHLFATSSGMVWHVSVPDVVVALHSDEQYPADGFLVDASLQLEAADGVEQSTWDTAHFTAPRPGTFPIVATADSFGTFRGAVTFVDRIERLETTVDPVGDFPDGDIPVRAGAIICAYGFTGTAEVYARPTFTLGEGMHMIDDQEDNCRYIIPDREGPVTITIAEPGITRTLELNAVPHP